MGVREDAKRIWQAAISAVQPNSAVRRALETASLTGNIHLVAIGKAAWSMANAAFEALGEAIIDGVVITKYDHSRGPIGNLQIFEAGHPVPDENSYRATRAAMELVRDVFIFCVYTGLAFIDVYNLRPEHVSEDSNGNLWIVKPREKTNNLCNIPLLSIPKQILEKYKDNPYCMDKGTLLPVPCNQKMNSYLKEIADLCGIKKNLTTHTARHSFASVIALANNVSLPNVAKMLGHSSTRMTQHYAKVLDQTILRDMQYVERKISFFSNFNAEL